MNGLEIAFKNIKNAIKAGNKAGLFELEDSAILMANLQEINQALFPSIEPQIKELVEVKKEGGK